MDVKKIQHRRQRRSAQLRESHRVDRRNWVAGVKVVQEFASAEAEKIGDLLVCLVCPAAFRKISSLSTRGEGLRNFLPKLYQEAQMVRSREIFVPAAVSGPRVLSLRYQCAIADPNHSRSELCSWCRKLESRQLYPAGCSPQRGVRELRRPLKAQMGWSPFSGAHRSLPPRSSAEARAHKCRGFGRWDRHFAQRRSRTVPIVVQVRERKQEGK